MTEMNEFEMIEKLVEKENVSFEEAAEALRACDGSLIDALILLERKKKDETAEESKAQTGEPGCENTGDFVFEELKEEEKVRTQERRGNRKTNQGSAVREFFRKAKELIFDNSFCVNRGESELVRIPVWLMAVILLINWKISAAALVIGLFLGCRYAFLGQSDLKGANNFMDKAGDMAERVKEQFAGNN